MTYCKFAKTSQDTFTIIVLDYLGAPLHDAYVFDKH